MKPVFIKKTTIINFLLLAVILSLSCGLYVLSQNQLVMARLQLAVTGTPLVKTAELSEEQQKEAYLESLMKQVTTQGKPEHQAVSFMVMLDENTDTKSIPKLLQIFADHDVRASFFVTGQFAEQNTDLLKGILARNHELGNHSYTSVSPSSLSLEENEAAMEKTYDAIFKATGCKTKLYAPPSGVLEEDVLKAAQHFELTYVLAGIDSFDWKEVPPEEIIGQVLRQAKPGSIIAIHPTVTTNEALPTLLKELQAKNLKMLTISEQLK